MPERRHFDRDFKLETVRMVTEQGRGVKDVAFEIGVHENTVYKWMHEYAGDPEYAFPGSGNLKPEQDELRKAKRRIADLEEEVLILKKAMAFFVKRPK